MMGVASWKVWRAGGGVLPLSLYAVQVCSCCGPVVMVISTTSSEGQEAEHY